MFGYKVREIFGGDDGKYFLAVCFDFDDGHEALSEFLGGDSELIFGHDFERFEEIMKEDHYESAGNAYAIEITPDNVTVTLQFDMDEERSECISREDFIWVMNEWARECRRVNKEYGKSPGKKPKNLFERFLIGVSLSARKKKGDREIMKLEDVFPYDKSEYSFVIDFFNRNVSRDFSEIFSYLAKGGSAMIHDYAGITIPSGENEKMVCGPTIWWGSEPSTFEMDFHEFAVIILTVARVFWENMRDKGITVYYRYKVDNTEHVFTEEKFLEDIEKFREKFLDVQ